MKAFFWLLKAAVFFILFLFALSNRHDVSLHFLMWNTAAVPMMVVLLASFTLGAVLGILVMVPAWWRMRKAAQLNTNASPNQPSNTTDTPATPHDTP